MFSFDYHNLELEEVVTFLYGRMNIVGRVCVVLKHVKDPTGFAYTLKEAHACNSLNRQFGFQSHEPEFMQVITLLEALARATPRLNVCQYANFGHGYAYSLINPLIRAAVLSVLDGYFTGYPVCDEFVARRRSSFSNDLGLMSRLVLRVGRGVLSLKEAGSRLMKCAPSVRAEDVRFLAFAVNLFLPIEQLGLPAEQADLIDFFSGVEVPDLPPAYEEVLEMGHLCGEEDPGYDSQEEPPEYSSLETHQHAAEAIGCTRL